MFDYTLIGERSGPKAADFRALMLINVRIFWDFLRIFSLMHVIFENWCINEKFEKNRTKNAYIDES